MGREIKFRGKRVDNGEWVYGYGVVVGEHYGRIHDEEREASIFVEYDKVSRLNFQLVDVSPETVGQYTGLKDKNGREIYEGDILTSPEYPFQDDGKYNYHGVIEWIDEESSFYMTKRLANPEKRGMSNGISQPIESIEEFEVIGDIYTNPELLEV